MMLVCSVFDVKSGSFAPPFYSRAKGEASRQFQIACQDDDLPFKKFPADFRLFILGTFDETTGYLTGYDRPDPVIGADEF